MKVTQGIFVCLVAVFFGSLPGFSQINATVSELDRKSHFYIFNFGSNGGRYQAPEPLLVTESGDWSLGEDENSGLGITLAFAGRRAFLEKRYSFNGDIQEFLCCIKANVSVDGNSRKIDWDERTRIITAAHIDYDINDSKASTFLLNADVVEIDANGFVVGKNAKSGWVNMPAEFTYKDSNSTIFVRLIDVSFWVTDRGRNWLSFSVGHAVMSASGSDSTPKEVHVEAAVAKDANTLGGSAEEGFGAASLRIGQHRFRVVLASLTSKMEFVEIPHSSMHDTPKTLHHNSQVVHHK